LVKIIVRRGFFVYFPTFCEDNKISPVFWLHGYTGLLKMLSGADPIKLQDDYFNVWLLKTNWTI